MAICWEELCWLESTSNTCVYEHITTTFGALMTSPSLDDLLEELGELSPIEEENPSFKDKSTLISSSGKMHTSPKKCSPFVYLGGSKFTFGMSSSSSGVSCCNRLFCLKCDFRVCIFGDHRWRADTDYLFLRNYVPDYARLQSRLLPSRDGTTAYCCQCKWINVRELSEMRESILDSNWVCMGH